VIGCGAADGDVGVCGGGISGVVVSDVGVWDGVCSAGALCGGGTLASIGCCGCSAEVADCGLPASGRVVVAAGATWLSVVLGDEPEPLWKPPKIKVTPTASDANAAAIIENG
jgi:hypothetical protein